VAYTVPSRQAVPKLHGRYATMARSDRHSGHAILASAWPG